MADPLWSRLKNALTGGPPPAHMQMRARRIVEPFHVRLWRTIRPPAKVPRNRKPRTRAQKLLLRSSAAAALLAVAGWFAYGYFASAEERSVAAVQDGMKLLGPGDYDAALGQFSAALAIWPGNAQAYLERGNAQNALGDTAEALADWTRAIDADPRLAAAYTARGTYYRVHGETEKALTDLNRSLEIKPSVDAYYQRGQAYHTLGQYPRAIQDFDRSIAELRDAPYVYRARSAARRAMGDLEGAAADRNTADRLEHAP